MNKKKVLLLAQRSSRDEKDKTDPLPHATESCKTLLTLTYKQLKSNKNKQKKPWNQPRVF
jgi:hypothetical protein